MLKEQLLAEAQNLDTPVELDSIFESVELSDDVKATFTTVFEQAVKLALQNSLNPTLPRSRNVPTNWSKLR